MYFVRNGKFPVESKVSDKIKKLKQNSDIYAVGLS